MAEFVGDSCDESHRIRKLTASDSDHLAIVAAGLKLSSTEVQSGGALARDSAPLWQYFAQFFRFIWKHLKLHLIAIYTHVGTYPGKEVLRRNCCLIVCIGKIFGSWKNYSGFDHSLTAE